MIVDCLIKAGIVTLVISFVLAVVGVVVLLAGYIVQEVM